jgi:hypothetical protein
MDKPKAWLTRGLSVVAVVISVKEKVCQSLVAEVDFLRRSM